MSTATTTQQKRARAFQVLVEKLQRSIANAATSIRLLMHDIIKPFWAHTKHRVLPKIHDGFFPYSFSFLEPSLDGESGDMLVPLRSKNGHGYIIPYSQTPEHPKGITSSAPAQLRLSSRHISFKCHDRQWQPFAHSQSPPRPWLPRDGGLVLYTFPEGYWKTTKLELADMRQEHALAQYTQIITHFETIFRQYDTIDAEMKASKSRLLSNVVVPVEFRHETPFFLEEPPNTMKRKRADEKAAMEAAFAAAAEAGEKHWFQSSKDEMRVKISRSDQICDRMLKMLQNNDEDDQDEEDEDNDSR
eukprot:INCI17800.1.p1 GENE.INCI17800.1~~INCI17800.1.p1  ORF type:complete len:302 (-),score=56.50 INCI17800.1:623-1528(-)